MAKVCVACGIVQGMVLDVAEYDRVRINHPGLGRIWENRIRPDSKKTVTVEGSARSQWTETVGDRDVRLIGKPAQKAGYGFTMIDESFWRKYVEQHPDSEVIKSGLLFAAPTLKAAREKARAHLQLRSGLEPVDGTSVVTGKNQYGMNVYAVADERLPRPRGRTANGLVAADGSPI